ncbi:MAG: type II toxin-antitoxin system PemK/MazF family toxin [Pyrinomonadaceae bacterium]|nr:type II toxin-antitoxin system PemK/MazF family toxin [Pyrinomonadaceae bacterium]
MIRGDVCYHTFKFPDKRRPVLILTRDILIPELNVVTIAPLTTTIRDESTQVLLDESDGVFEVCAVNLTNIQTVPKEKIGGCLTHLSDEKMREVFEAIRFALGFDT